MNDTALFNLLLAVIGGPAAFAAVFLAARALVHNDGRGAYAKEYIRRHRAERASLQSSPERQAAARSAAAELMRPTQQEWLEQRRRRPVAAVTATPHAETDTRWSVLNGGHR